jgi:hypothetical protein
MVIRYYSWVVSSSLILSMASYNISKANSFLGIARIDLDQISFTEALDPDENHRAKSQKDIARLLNVFELEGCIRSEDRNFIEGLISEDYLDTALSTAGISKESFEERSRLPIRHTDDIVHVRLRGPIQCNDGLHRISAAKQFLDNNDRWWVVKLYKREGESENF